VIDTFRLNDWADLRVNRIKHPQWCETVGVTIGQSADIVILYLKNHPGTRNQPAASEVWSAMRAAFPCDSAAPNAP